MVLDAWCLILANMFIVNYIQNLPPQLATFLLAMLPLTELRASIPIAIGVFHLPVWQAFLWSILGDIIPAIFIVWFLQPIALWLSERSKVFKKLFDWWFNRVIKNFEKKHEKYGAWALMIFVAIPLPITGAWTGAVASFLFKIPRKKAILFITLGVILAGIIVTLITTGAFRIF